MSGLSPSRLENLDFLRVADAADVQRAATHFEAVELSVGHRFFTQDKPAHGLGILLSGKLALRVADTVVDTVLAGAIVGEEAGFLPFVEHAASVEVVEPSEWAWIPADELQRLRDEVRSVYDVLLVQATLTLVRRVRAVSTLIAKEATGQVEAPTRQQASTLSRIWRAIVPGGPKTECPPLPPLLRHVPGLEEAEPTEILSLVKCFSPISFEEGKRLFLEGDQGDTMYLLAEGEVDVLRRTGGDRAVLLATLGPGSLLGLNALVEPARRTASCVARTAGWAYTTDTSRFRDPPRAARTVWRESVLLDLATQLRRSAVNLVRAGEEPIAPAEGSPGDGEEPAAPPAAQPYPGKTVPSGEDDPLDVGLEDDWL